MTQLPVVDGGPIVPLRLPEPDRLFAARAARLEALAEGHAAGPYLALLARIARGQDVAARELRGIPVHPGPVEASHEPGRRGPTDGPFSVRPELVEGRTEWRFPLDSEHPDPTWRAALRIVLAPVQRGPLPGPAAEAVRRLEAMGASELDALAAGTLGLELHDPPAAPFVLAAIEVALARRAAMLMPASVPRAETGCPVCGGPPVASVVSGQDRLRYVSCGRCASRWHLTRVHCGVCRGNAGISYFHVEGAPPGARAEACESCKAYLKIFDQEELPGADPVADDAATIVLDLLMAERGWRRAGHNPLAPGGERA